MSFFSGHYEDFKVRNVQKGKILDTGAGKEFMMSKRKQILDIRAGKEFAMSKEK